MAICNKILFTKTVVGLDFLLAGLKFDETCIRTRVKKDGCVSLSPTVLYLILAADSTECRRKKNIIPCLKVCVV